MFWGTLGKVTAGCVLFTYVNIQWLINSNKQSLPSILGLAGSMYTRCETYSSQCICFLATKALSKRIRLSTDPQNRMETPRAPSTHCSDLFLYLGRQCLPQRLLSTPLPTSHPTVPPCCCRARNTCTHLYPQPEAAGHLLSPFLFYDPECSLLPRASMRKVHLLENSEPIVLYLIWI